MAIAVLKLNGSEMMKIQGQKYYNRIRKNKNNYELFFALYNVTKNGEIFRKSDNKRVTIHVAKSGYNSIQVFTKQLGRFRCSVHRLVAMKYVERPEHLKHISIDELSVNHKDGNKSNNCFENLEWCTVYENNKHAREHGLNNISKSNSERWLDENFSIKTKNKLIEYRKNNPLNGRDNPMFKYELIFENSKYTVSELSKKLNISASKIYRLIYTDVEKLQNFGVTVTIV